MKSILTNFFALAAVVLAASIAHATVSGSWTYILNSSDQAILKACDPKTKGAVAVPAKIDGYPVIALDGTFSKCKYITSVVIPRSVVLVGVDAFYKCERLKSIDFEDYTYGVRFEGPCFKGASKVKRLVLPLGSTFSDSFLAGSSITELEVLDLSPSTAIDNLDLALTHRNTRGDLDVKVKTLIVPNGADYYEWATDLIDFFKSSKHKLGFQYPRAWVSTVAEGGGTLKVGSQTYNGTVAVKPGTKVSFVAKGASGYTPQDTTVDINGTVTTYRLANSRTVTMGTSDVTFSATFVKTSAERAKLDAVADGLKLTPADFTVDGVACCRGWLYQVFSRKLAGLETVLSKTTCTITGLPKGLALMKGSDGYYYIQGVPTSKVNFSEAPAYVTLKSLSGYVRVVRLNLDVQVQKYSPTQKSHHSLCTTSATGSLSLGADYAGYTPVSLPSGISYNPTTKALSVSVNAENVGFRTIVFQKEEIDPSTGSPVTVKRYVNLQVSDNYLPGNKNAAFSSLANFQLNVGEESPLKDCSAVFSGGTDSAAIVGLPTGLKFDRSTLMITGRPTKTGVFNSVFSMNYGGTAYRKVVPWRVFAKDWKTTGLLAGVNPGATGQTQKNGVITMLAGMSFPKTNGSYDLHSSETKATMSVSGLPKGLSLVKTAPGEFTISGRATATGKSIVTIKATANGVTKTERIAYDVIDNPLKGSYRGSIFTPYVGAGAVSMSVAANGLATMSITEGKTTTKVTAYPKFRSGYVWDQSKPTEGDFTLAFPIKANKTLKTKARTVRVGFKSLQLNGVVQHRCGPQSAFSVETDDGASSKGTAYSFTCYPVISGEALTAHSFYKSAWRCDATTFAYDTNGTGWDERILSTARFDWAGGKVKVFARLPLGKTYSATLPIVADFHASDTWTFSGETSWRSLIVAPVVATDADGAVYSVILPCDPSEKNTGWDTATEVYSGCTRQPWHILYAEKKDYWPNTYWDKNACFCYGVRSNKLFEASPATYVGSTPTLDGCHGSLGSWTYSTVCEASANALFVGASIPQNLVPFTYDKSTGLFKMTFVRSGRTYTFEGVPVSADGKTMPTQFRGLMSYKNSSKTYWGVGSLHL